MEQGSVRARFESLTGFVVEIVKQCFVGEETEKRRTSCLLDHSSSSETTTLMSECLIGRLDSFLRTLCSGYVVSNAGIARCTLERQPGYKSRNTPGRLRIHVYIKGTHSRGYTCKI